MTSPAPRPAVPPALTAMVISGGAAALSWESIWQLQASLAFGVSAAGTALTLAATMGGMTAGSLLAGRWLSSRSEPAHPLRWYGMLELVIGLSGLLVVPGFRVLEAFDAWAFGVSPQLAPWLHGIGMALWIAPASLAMGATVPVFQRVAVAHRTSISRLYAANTLGAAGGVLVMSFLLLPALGVTRSCVVLAMVNLAVFVGSRVLTRDMPPSDAPAERGLAARARVSERLPFPVAVLVVSYTGFVTFGLEVVWFRALRAAFWSTTGTFAILLASVLLPLAIGARLVPWLRARGARPGSLLALAGGFVLLATPLVERMDLAASLPGSYGLAMLAWLGLTLLVVGPAIICLATVLPWCLEDHSAPDATARLYACNAAGSVAGSLVAAWGLLPLFGASRSAWGMGVLVLATGIWLARPRQRPAFAAAGLACLALAFTASSSVGRERVQFHSDRAGYAILAHHEGPDFTASVLESQAGERMLFIDGFVATTDALRSAHYMEWMGRLPAILHPAPRRGLVICFGTGQTANGLRRERLEAIDVVEISPAVLALAPLFPRNDGVLRDPTVRAIAMDGRAWLRRGRLAYDVITLEPMPPNFAGVNALYSREFYEIMQQRLAPGGIVAQWLPVQLLSDAHARAIARTFVEAFPDALLWFDPIGGMPILLGRRAGESKLLGEVWPGLGRARRDLSPTAIRRSVWLDIEALRRYVEGAALVTDDNQLLQWGPIRPRADSRVARALQERNLATLASLAGRPAFSIRGAASGRPPR